MLTKTIYTVTVILLLCFVSGTLLSCSENADFSSDASLRLNFSSDIVSFDTLFSTIGSSTVVLQVYNRNSSSLKIKSVVQKSGGESKFRVNVDGQSATFFSDLDIRKRDSMYVFVEITPPSVDSDRPFLITDSLTFNLESGVSQTVTLLAYGRDAIVVRGEVLSNDTTLSPLRPYIIYDSLVVAENSKLTIPPGVFLYFHSKAQLLVKGTLVCEGTTEQPVVFRGDRVDNMFSYLPYDRVPGQWGGIQFFESSNNNYLKGCDIHSAEFGIKLHKGDSLVQRLRIEDSRIENINGNGLEATAARIDVINSLIANAGGNCVRINGGDVRFIHCTIANFYVWSSRNVALYLCNNEKNINYPLREALFANCIVTGSKKDELEGKILDLEDVEGNYLFVSSLINTKKTDDKEHFRDVVWDVSESFGKGQFLSIDNTIYKYDFHLSQISSAKGVGSKDYVQFAPFDLDGNPRLSLENIDAGCYNFIKE